MKTKSYREHKIGYMECSAHLSKYSIGAIKNIQLARSNAYLMAEHYINMEKLDSNQLQRDIKVRFPGHTPFDDMVAKDFAPLIAIGEDPYELFQIIRDGVKQAAYLKSPVTIAIGGKKKKQKLNPTTSPAPDPPDEDIPLEQQLKIWRARAESLSQEVKRLQGVEKENIQLRRRIKRIEKLIAATSE